MANDRWEDDDRRYGDPDRERQHRHGSERGGRERQDFGRDEGRQAYGENRDDQWRRARDDQGWRGLDRQDQSRRDHRESSYDRYSDSPRGYGSGGRYGRDQSGRDTGSGSSDYGSRSNYGSSTGYDSGSNYGPRSVYGSGANYGGGPRYRDESRYSGSVGYGSPDYSGSRYSGPESEGHSYTRERAWAIGSGYGEGYGSSNYSEPSRDRDSSVNRDSSGRRYGGGQYGSDYGQGSPGYREDWRRGREAAGSQDWQSASGHERGWWDRTKDEVRAWMGDEEANRRRRMDEAQRVSHYGRGPRGYARSDARLLEDVSDRLTEDWSVDASEIEVTVVSGEVTLTGTVDSRDMKRRAENVAADVSGVKDVQNNLRVRQPSQQSGNLTGSSSSALEQTTGLSSASTPPTGGTTAGTQSTTGSGNATQAKPTQPKH